MPRRTRSEEVRELLGPQPTAESFTSAVDAAREERTAVARAEGKNTPGSVYYRATPPDTEGDVWRWIDEWGMWVRFDPVTNLLLHFN